MASLRFTQQKRIHLGNSPVMAVVLRSAATFLLASTMLCSVVASSLAQNYPSKTITIVVGFAPGGLMDSVSRVIGAELSSRLGQQVIVENRPGANGNIAHRRVATAAPDGYSILGATTTFAGNESIYANRGYTASQFETVAIVASSPELLSTHPDNAKTLDEYLKDAKKDSAQFGTAGTGSTSHISIQYFFDKIAQVPTTHVPFLGGAPAVNAALGNQIKLVASPPASGAGGLVKSGRLRGLAIASEKRFPLLPDVPTFAEIGYPNFISSVWGGFFVPANTPKDITLLLNSKINEILRDPAVISKLETLGFVPIQLDQPSSEKMFRSEIAKWRGMVEAIGLKVE